MDKLIEVRSDAVSGVAYDPGKNVLTVQFRSGGLYQYDGVPESLYEDFLAAQPHPWSECGAEIKRYAFRRVAG